MSTTKTFRGRTLEEVLPRIRAELGPEALVLARREGLAGGVGGFFQRSYIEVEARGPVEDPELELRSDRATSEGLSTPGIQALLASASPFANQLAAARLDPGLYGPQPAAPAPEPEAPAAPDPEPEAAAPPAPAPVAPAPVPAAPAAAPPQASVLRSALEEAGLPAGLAAGVVDEAVRHGVPFGSPRALKTLVRAELARRIGVMGPLGPGPRTVVIAGAAGSGKTTAATRLAAAYRAAGQPVRELAAGDVTARESFDGLTVIDAPATGVRDADRIAAVAAALEGLGAEVHLALPATLSAAAARGLTRALAPLGPTHVLLTHADETEHPGAPIGHAMTAGLPLSYVAGADELAPADPAALARRLV